MQNNVEKEKVDFDFDEIEEEIPTQSSSMSVEDFDQKLQELVAKNKKQTEAYIDHRLAKVDDRLKTHAQLLEKHDARLDAIDETLKSHNEILLDMQKERGEEPRARVVKPQATTQEQLETQSKNPNILDMTLGTVGGVLHGVVDTAAFILESTVDLITLGRARRPQETSINQHQQ